MGVFPKIVISLALNYRHSLETPSAVSPNKETSKPTMPRHVYVYSLMLHYLHHW